MEITQIIKKVADCFHVNPLEAVLSHELKQYVIDGNNVILGREEVDQKGIICCFYFTFNEHTNFIVTEYAFEENQAYCIDIVMSTGRGNKLKEGANTRTTVYKRSLDRNYQLKSQASRDLLKEINTKFPSLPFSLRYLFVEDGRRGTGSVDLTLT
jgi:hypothetical protein